ncbi:Uncharacterised protein [Salmonella enterica subsp. enterica]|nr:Uncharacterised protein [Salmonella enterica subsp. enterica]
MVKQTTAQAYGVITFEVFQQLTNFSARFRADDKVQPGGVGTRAWRGNNFDGLTAAKRLRQRIRLPVDTRADAGVTDVGMHCIGKSTGVAPAGSSTMRPSGVKTLNLIREEIGFYAFDKFKRTTGALL